MLRTPQFHVQVKTSEKAMRVDQEMLENLKKSLGGKMISRMKKEYVECPVANQNIPFLLCFNCVSFIRRVQGVVDCEGKEYRVRAR